MNKYLYSFIFSFFLYIIAPVNYSNLFCIVVTILYIFQTIFFVIEFSNKNYLNFYSIFFFSYFFVNFFYPAFIYPLDPEFFSIFRLHFNRDYINTGTALAQLASGCFVVGASFLNKYYAKNNKVYNSKLFLHHNTFLFLTIILFLIFFITVGNEFLSGNFIGYSTFSLYILQILICSFILCSIVFFKYYNNQKQKYYFYFISLFFILLFVSIGDRGPGLFLIVLIVTLYSTYVKIIKLKYIFVLLFIGLFSMHIIGLGRTTKIETIDTNIINRGIKSFDHKVKDNYLFHLTESFVVNTRNLYVGIEYVDKYGINYGSTMYMSFLATIPFLQSAFEKTTLIKLKNSATFFTELSFGRFPAYGLGTNLVADVYISFGTLGVILLFFIFGVHVEYFRSKMSFSRNIYPEIVYFCMVYFCLYYPRSGLFDTLKFLIWTCIIYTILNKFNLFKKYNKNL